MPEVERMDDEAIRELARRIVINEVYAAWTPEQLDYSFSMILMLGGHTMTPEFAESIGLVYEETHKASDRAVNGHPVFMSCRYAHADDRHKIMFEVLKMQHAIGSLTDEQMAKAQADWDRLQQHIKESEATDG